MSTFLYQAIVTIDSYACASLISVNPTIVPLGCSNVERFWRSAMTELQSLVTESRSTQMSFGAMDISDVELVRGAMETLMSALTPIETSQGPNTQVQPAESYNKDVPIIHVDMHTYSLDEKIRMTLEAHIVEKTDEVHEVSFVGFSSQAKSFCKTMDRTFAIDLYSNIQGAGGILMIVPLFQRVLSTSELLGCSPDIACYAKLMTEFMALLHDHSYTAH
ncbi:hypothetical protein ACJX0J_036979, partial [Zea mays]